MLSLDARPWVPAFAGAFLVALLAACGGGGGGGGGTTTPPADGGTPPSTSSSGLVPAAPATGAVLEADASALRVMRDGATWNFRGVEQPFGDDVNRIVYANKVVHKAGSGFMAETSTNLFNEGADSSDVVTTGGTVRYTTLVDLTGNGTKEAIEDVELRSPVRVNDQYVLLDRRIQNSGRDFDGDGRNDAIDVALWRRVVGEETLDLLARRQVRAVRVDLTLRQRVTYTSDGKSSDVVEVSQSIWYARGLGVVKARLDTPSAAAARRRIVTEQLETWDGLSEGLGHTPVTLAKVPAGALAGASLTQALDAQAFANHAVVASGIPGQFPSAGFSLTHLDARGRVVASAAYRAADLGASMVTFHRLARVGDSLFAIYGVDSRIDMVELDATGQTRRASPVTLLRGPVVFGSDSGALQVVGRADRLWAAWMQPSPEFNGSFVESDVFVASFATDGSARSTALQLAKAAPSQIKWLSLGTSASDPVLVSWGQSRTADDSPLHYAVVDPVGGALVSRKQPVTAGWPQQFPMVTAVAMEPGLALINGRRTEQLGFSGVRLDAAYDLARANNGPLSAETITPSWLESLNDGIVVAGAQGRLFLGGTQWSRPWPEMSRDVYFTHVTELVPGTGALSAPAQTNLLARIPQQELMSFKFLLPMKDTLLVIGATDFSSSGQLATTSVWRQR